MPLSPLTSEPLYSPQERAALLGLARRSISHGLSHRSACEVVLSDYPERLRELAASFVTLHLDGALRGCIGSLEAREALVKDVARHAFAAAFRDPRFPALSSNEFDMIEIHLSVLSNPKPLPVRDEAELLAKLRPGEDGLIFEEGRHRSTFLPSVWEQLPNPRDFVGHLKRKAGLPADYWSHSIRLQRYTTESFSSQEY